MGGSRVQRHDHHHDQKRKHKRHPRPCRSAPDVPGSVDQNFIRYHVSHKTHWRDKVTWDAVTADVAGRPVPILQYEVQIRQTDSGGAPLNTDVRKHFVASDDSLHAIFLALDKARSTFYQARVRAQIKPTQAHPHAACWSVWSGWSVATKPSSGATIDDPAAVTVTAPQARVLSAEWDEPANPEDVDRYRVEWYKGATLRKTFYTRSLHHRYHVPEADRGANHTAKVFSIDEDGADSGVGTSGSADEGGTLSGSVMDPETAYPPERLVRYMTDDTDLGYVSVAHVFAVPGHAWAARFEMGAVLGADAIFDVQLNGVSVATLTAAAGSLFAPRTGIDLDYAAGDELTVAQTDPQGATDVRLYVYTEVDMT